MTAPLVLTPNIEDGDLFYERLIAAQAGLDEARSADFVLRLTLILANQIGDQSVLLQCIEAARIATGRSGEIP